MLANTLYRAFISRLTLRCYDAFFQQIPSNAKILDVGIGNGLMLERHHETIRSRNIRYHGVDLCKPYLKACEATIGRYNLSDLVSCEYGNILDHDFKGETYDYIFFSMSLPLIDEKEKALAIAESMLKDSGQIAMCLTLESRRSKFMEFVKPKLKYMIGVDFGKVTYETTFLQMLQVCKFRETFKQTVQRVSPNSKAELILVKPVFAKAGKLKKSTRRNKVV